MRLDSVGETASPIFPSVPLGRPGLREISNQWSPPSVDLNSPLPGPPDDISQELRNASHSPAYSTCGLLGSRMSSIAPVLSSRKRIRSQVFPPSFDRNTPRSAFGRA